MVRGGPLQGVRVVELTKVWAGPYAGKLLGFLGAEVIKVESNNNLDELRAYGGVDINNAPYFLSVNQEVQSIQLNMKLPEGMKQLRDLIAKSDIVINNLRPGAMERSALGYGDLKKIKSDIISVSIKMYGNEGPLGYQTGYAPSFAALGGLNNLVGYEGEAPGGINMRYGDSTVGASAAFAAITALVHRQRTGEGQSVDVSAVETMSSMVGDALFRYGLTGEIPAADANAHADIAPHGCYPCDGGEWLALSAENDTQWNALCTLLGLADDADFATLAQRLEHRNALDAIIAKSTAPHAAEALAEQLRAAGVPAFKSKSSLDLIQDDFLWSHGFFRMVSDHTNGTRPITGAPWRLSKTDAPIERGAPLLGEHNSYVYKELLGLSEERYQELIQAGVID